MLTVKAPKRHRVTRPVRSETGTLTTLDLYDYTLVVIGTGHLADHAHVAAVDPHTHRSYYPVPASSNGHPGRLERQPS
jgi:hypothetical protein